MLVLSRRVREKIYFPGLNLTVQIVGVTRGRVRVAIEAPPEVTVLRDELRGRQRNRDAANVLTAPPRKG
jgi:carbon storage regulator CsrA